MKTNAWLRYQRLRHPILCGGAEAAASALVALFALGLVGPMVGAPAWTVLLWAALAFRRPPIYQAAAAVTLCVGSDLLSGAVVGSSLIPMGAAMLLANAWMGRSGKRWDRAHAGFAGAAVIGTLVTEALLGDIPGLGRVLNSIFLLILVAAILAGWQAWRSRRPRSVRRRFPAPRTDP
ncbi:hypothetical protein KQI84_05230 [bacterium]|nr:hypothetical protein [bacterium]